MAKAKKFGMFGGVFTPSILTILGVIMYLRLPWIVGQAGLWSTLGIIFVAHLISISTGLSVSSIATDKKVETGGTYYIISRSLGLPIGGTLGWALFIGLSFSVSLYLIGFAEVFLGYFGFAVNITNIRIAGIIVLLVVTILTFISTSLAIKTQYFILTAMVLSLLSVFLGRHDFVPEQPQLTSLPDSLPWIALFAIFFPAVTGFEAGVSMSGDLRDPRSSIPRGTLMAILVGLVVYVGLVIFFSYGVNASLLVGDPNVLFAISLVPQLVIAGILGATFSSALGSILGAPRILQAVATDRIAPRFFSKGHGPSKEPRNALILTFFIALSGILIGELNVIARIVTIFFIITYGFLNITYAVESWASSDFRPSFKIPRLVSIIGAIASIVIMIQLDIMAMIAASIVLLLLFFYLKRQELTLQTGDTWSSIWLSLVKTGLRKLSKTRMNVRDWRPNVILMGGAAGERPYLISFAKAMVGKLGVFTNFELIAAPVSEGVADARLQKAFGASDEEITTRRYACNNVYEGIDVVSKMYGFSGFEPNTLLMGWPANTEDPRKMSQLLMSLDHSNYNLTLLHYNKQVGFGNRAQIDCWWEGSGRELTLALHLIRFLTADPEWRHSKIRLLAITDDRKLVSRYYSLMQHMLGQYRVSAERKVILVNGNADHNAIIRDESAGASLTFLRLPRLSDDNAADVMQESNRLAHSLQSFLFIQASADFDDVRVTSDAIIKADTTEMDEITSENFPPIQILHFSDYPTVQHEMQQLATALQKMLDDLHTSCWSAIARQRSDLLMQYHRQLIALLQPFIPNSDATQHQYSLNELQATKKALAQLMSNELSESQLKTLDQEQENFAAGMDDFLHNIQQLIASFPSHLINTHTKDDFLQSTPDSGSARVNRNIQLLRFRLGKSKLPVRIYTRTAVTAHVYAASTDSLNHLWEDYLQQSILFYASLDELSSIVQTWIDQLIETGAKSPDADVDSVETTLNAKYQSLLRLNQRAFLGLSADLSKAIRSQLEALSTHLAHPQANYRQKHLSRMIKVTGSRVKSPAEFSSAWLRYMHLQVQHHQLDAYYLQVKSELSLLMYKAWDDQTQLLEGKLLRQVRNLRFKPGHNHDFVSAPDISPVYQQLQDSLKIMMQQLPERLEIAAQEPAAGVNMEMIDQVERLEVYFRKTIDFHVSNVVTDQLLKQSAAFSKELIASVAKINNLIKLANYHLGTRGDYAGEPSRMPDHELQQLQKNLQAQAKSMEEDLLAKVAVLRDQLDGALMTVFRWMNASSVDPAAVNLTRKIIDTDQRRWMARIRVRVAVWHEAIVRQWVWLFYHQSRSRLWAERMEVAKQGVLLNPADSIHQLLKRISAGRNLLQKIPLYYTNLFTDVSVSGGEFWVGMQEEVRQGHHAISQFLGGASGMVVVAGDRGAGKTAITVHLAEQHFHKKNIIRIGAPSTCSADVIAFEALLLNHLHSKVPDALNVQQAIELLPDRKTIIVIDDLEMWWERTSGGTVVLEYILKLVQHSQQHVLFMVTVHTSALQIMNRLTEMNAWTLGVVLCRPMDALDLKSLILSRHQAGGLTLVWNHKEEPELTNWDYARFFTTLFELSNGNPGTAIQLWFAHVRNIDEQRLIMHYPSTHSITFTEQLTPQEILVLLQLILHRRFTVPRLAGILQQKPELVENTVRNLLHKGILTDYQQGIVQIHPSLENPLIKKLKILELL